MENTGQMMKNAFGETCSMRKAELRRETGVHGGEGRESKVCKEERTILQRMRS